MNVRKGSFSAYRNPIARLSASRRKPTFVKGVHLLSQTIFE